MLEVSLRFCRLPAQRHAASYADLAQLLSPSERERCARLTGAHADRALVARALVRSELAVALSVAPSALVFAAGQHGKPRLVCPPQPIAFNLSHSGEWLVLAWHLAPDVGPLGVDIEHRGTGKRDVMRLARRYFSAAEQRSLAALSGDAQATLFYRLWTLKEAWVKAHGLALAPQLGAIAFDFHPEGLRVTHASSGDRGRFLHGEPGADTWSSLCVLGAREQPARVDARLGMPLGSWQNLPLGRWSGSLCSA